MHGCGSDRHQFRRRFHQNVDIVKAAHLLEAQALIEFFRRIILLNVNSHRQAFLVTFFDYVLQQVAACARVLVFRKDGDINNADFVAPVINKEATGRSAIDFNNTEMIAAVMTLVVLCLCRKLLLNKKCFLY